MWLLLPTAFRGVLFSTAFSLFLVSERHFYTTIIHFKLGSSFGLLDIHYVLCSFGSNGSAKRLSRLTQDDTQGPPNF
ncbi:hypothetical protein B0O99DRAFT_25133 [Bisporella sp. PMI_857]|nr:hypothetical protein B0O99DRAFT_25133 [Bisporella sp. PMI_857]